ncbi:MAG TPA: phosphodiester glycosidase family protein, partial [Fimbriimonadaceae bacterium]|nr:phosphodiester glycosidase family protein [Fimbriimonadaceae bacterium]
PWHTVITGGEVVHIGNTGSVIGFWDDGRAAVDRPQFTISGAREGQEKHPFRWYAYWLNRRPTSNTVTIFTRHWGRETGLDDGRHFVVRKGAVTWIEQASQEIPADGWVLYQRGVSDSAFGRITMGSNLSYRVLDKNSPDGNWGAFEGVREAVGAGPTLVKGGKVAYAPETEGFSHEKILSIGGARSLAGFNATGELLLVASSGTVREMASLMQQLGCREAINLDGGASSGLIANGKTIRTPGRSISNALLVLPR